jgi:hypothetical protein
VTTPARTLNRAVDAIALPPADETVDALDAEVRAALAAIWLERASSELGAAAGFATLVPRILQPGIARDVQWLAARAVADEVRHAEVCRRVASSYLGADAPWPAARAPAGRAAHVPSELRVACAVVATSCVSETLGTAFLERALSEATAEPARSALRALLSDEIDHARIGWAYIASLPAADRVALGPHLPAVLTACNTVWSERIASLPPVGAPAHGCPLPADIAPVLFAALRDLVLPGLAHVGIPDAPARGWVEERSRERAGA